MNEIKTEPLATPTEPPEAPQPPTSAKASEANPTEPAKPKSWMSSLPAIVQKSPGKLALYVVLAFFGLFAIEFAAQIPRWVREAHVRRVNRIVDTVTPASLIARCGQPVNDVTNDLYPMISRRMTYNSPLIGTPGPGKVILLFTRTAEENSDWVYSSMRDESGATSYNTPDEQLVALPCLATTK